MGVVNVWPNGVPVAVVINLMYEQWDEARPPGLGPMGNPLKNGLVDYQALSWSAYGRETGVWKVLDLLEEQDVEATFYASGVLAESKPESLRAIVDGGHELAAHAWTQDVMLPAYSFEEEDAEIERCVTALERVSGQRPVGWMSPRCTPSANTAAILVKHGFSWIGDVFDRDLPYDLETPEGTITAFPFGLEINDVPMNVRYGLPTRELYNGYVALAEAVRENGELAYLDITFHAHVGARPAGRATLRKIIQHAKEQGFWIATRSAVLKHISG